MREESAFGSGSRAICLALLLAALALVARWESGTAVGAAVAGAALAMGLLTLWRPSTEHERPQSGRWDLLAVCLVLIVAGHLRFYALDSFPALPNVDEGINGNIILKILEEKGVGPVLTDVFGEEAYSYYLQAWVFELFDRTLGAFRALPAFVGMLFPALVYLVARRFTGIGPALLAALLVSFDATHVRYSREGNSIVYVTTLQAIAFLFLVNVLRHGRPNDCAGLGFTLLVGCHSYPAFRAVTAVSLALLAAAVLLGRVRQWQGPVLAFLLVLVAMMPFLQTAHVDIWHARVEQVTWLNDGVSVWLERLLPSLQRAITAFIGGMRTPPLNHLFPPLIPALALLGLVEYLRRTGKSQKLPFPDGRCALLWLGGVLLTGLAPAIVCKFEPDVSRRYILLLFGTYLLVALGLQRVGSALAASRNPLLLRGAGFSALAASAGLACFVAGQSYVSSIEERFQATYTLSAFARFSKHYQPAVLPSALVCTPFLPGQSDASPEVDFLRRLLGLPIARGLNPYPAASAGAEVHYVLGDPFWDRFIISSFHDGRRWTWTDPAAGGLQFEVYSVRGEEVFRDHGLKLVAAGPSARVEQRVFDLFAEQPPVAARGKRTWTGYLYIPQSGYWNLSLRGTGILGMRVGGIEADADIAGWYAEGWQALKITQVDGGSRAPDLFWCQRGRADSTLVPSYALRRNLVAPEQLLARPAAPRAACALARSGPLREVEDPLAWLQDIAVSRDRVYQVLTGPRSLRCFTFDGKRQEGWKGLRDQAGNPIVLNPGFNLTRYELSIASSPEGDLAIADTLGHRVLFVTPDGVVKNTYQFESPWPAPNGVAFEPVRRTFLATDRLNNRIHRFSVSGRPLPSWHVDGPNSLCVRPDGRAIFATIPARDGIAVLSPEGEEVAFWRAVSINELSSIECDGQGRLLVVIPGRRIMAYDPEGRVLIPNSPMPETIEGVNYTTAGMDRGPRGDIFLAVDGQFKGWTRVELFEVDESWPSAPPLASAPRRQTRL